MYAEVGNWLVVHSRSVDVPVREGQIVEVPHSDGSPPYVVHWLDQDRLSTVFPGPDTTVSAVETLLVRAKQNLRKARARLDVALARVERRHLVDRRRAFAHLAARALEVVEVRPAARVRAERARRERERTPHAGVAHLADRVGQEGRSEAIALVDVQAELLREGGHELADARVERALAAEVRVVLGLPERLVIDCFAENEPGSQWVNVFRRQIGQVRKHAR